MGSMQFGVRLFASELTIDPRRLAVEARARRFESVLFSEHTHIPTSRRSPYPPGGDLPENQKHSFDPFVALGAVAATAPALTLGTSVCLLAQRDPLLTAKAVATLVERTGQPFVLGVGVGWNREEAEDHGVVWHRRRDMVRERVDAMRRLWSDDVASFQGEFVRFSESWQWPKPSPQRVEVLLGGDGPRCHRDVAAYADGWMPADVADVEAGWSTIKRLAEEGGRDPGQLHLSVCLTSPAGRDLERYATCGAERVIALLPVAAHDEVLVALDQAAAARDAFVGGAS